MPLCFSEKIHETEWSEVAVAIAAETARRREREEEEEYSALYALVCIHLAQIPRWKILSQGLKMRKCDSASKKKAQYILCICTCTDGFAERALIHTQTFKTPTLLCAHASIQLYQYG